MRSTTTTTAVAKATGAILSAILTALIVVQLFLSRPASGQDLRDQTYPFNTTCLEWGLYKSVDDRYLLLKAYCPNMSGDYKCSYLDLDACFANIDGDVWPQKDGMFYQRCTDCHPELTGGWRNPRWTWLRCRCLGDAAYNDGIDDRGDTPIFDMSDTIRNYAGVLTCFDNIGYNCKEDNPHWYEDLMLDHPEWTSPAWNGRVWQ